MKMEKVCNVLELIEYYFSIDTAALVLGACGAKEMLKQECSLEVVIMRYFPLWSLQEDGPKK